MALSNGDIFSWVEQAQADLSGVKLAIGGLDPDESRDAVARLVAFLAAFATVQDVHLSQLQASVPVFREMRIEHQLRALQAWIEDVPAGTPFLRGLMLEDEGKS